MPKGRQKEKKKIKKMPPNSYITMPHCYPTEQIDIVKKMKPKRRGKKK